MDLHTERVRWPKCSRPVGMGSVLQGNKCSSECTRPSPSHICFLVRATNVCLYIYFFFVFFLHQSVFLLFTSHHSFILHVESKIRTKFRNFMTVYWYRACRLHIRVRTREISLARIFPFRRSHPSIIF